MTALPTRLSGDGWAIQTSGLHKSFGKTVALRGIDLTVPHGAVYVLVGPNGAGRTTALRIRGMRLVAGATKLTAVVAPIDVVVSSLWKALAGPLGGEGPEVVVNGSRYTVAFAVWGTHYLLWIAVAMAALLFSVFRFRDAH